jgi:hypothetical protein
MRASPACAVAAALLLVLFGKELVLIVEEASRASMGSLLSVKIYSTVVIGVLGIPIEAAMPGEECRLDCLLNALSSSFISAPAVRASRGGVQLSFPDPMATIHSHGSTVACQRPELNVPVRIPLRQPAGSRCIQLPFLLPTCLHSHRLPQKPLLAGVWAQCS